MGEGLEDGGRETSIGRRNQILDPYVRILREAGRRGITWFHQPGADIEIAKLMRERAGEALDRLLAGRIGGR
ncbi:hypothetical protein GCM10007858_75410 [Bradyrhizobium liaoningense]|nr:hypothetical protein GCM10007858_75410 [Bradyrhizobium liaoningense]